MQSRVVLLNGASHASFETFSTIPYVGMAFGMLVGPANAQNAVTQVVIDAGNSVPVYAVPAARGLQGNSASPNETKGVSPKPNASAPPLTRVFINNVCTGSSGTGCETISSGQTATANVYTGANVYTFVWEIGYGTGEIAHQGGSQISNAYLVAKTPVCVSGNQYTINCPASSSIVGFRYEWNNGFYFNQGYAQNFAAQDTSQNPPINTYYVSLTIQYHH